MRRRGVEEAADEGNSEFAARCELAGSGEVDHKRASGKVETDAELATAELGDWLADDEPKVGPSWWKLHLRARKK